ncbi:hypothetical protein Btru_048382 [Bulinus truncatus]|nr:hypothetical protein Btru_048382 [Bulinus truncatus]
MYMAIKEESNGFQARSHMCLNKSGDLLIENEMVLERWPEQGIQGFYFFVICLDLLFSLFSNFLKIFFSCSQGGTFFFN